MQTFIVKNPCVAAEQWDGQSKTFGNLFQKFGELISLTKDLRIVVITPEGPMTATIGDWIVKDASDTVFVMKDDIFNIKYRPLSRAATASSAIDRQAFVGGPATDGPHIFPVDRNKG